MDTVSDTREEREITVTDDADFECDAFDQLKEMFKKPYSYRKCWRSTV